MVFVSKSNLLLLATIIIIIIGKTLRATPKEHAF